MIAVQNQNLRALFGKAKPEAEVWLSFNTGFSFGNIKVIRKLSRFKISHQQSHFHMPSKHFIVDSLGK